MAGISAVKAWHSVFQAIIQIHRLLHKIQEGKERLPFQKIYKLSVFS